MMGDGIEQTWLSKYIESQGLDHELLFTVYGISIAISSWLSGVIAETIGVRKTMWLGFAIYLVGMAGFAGLLSSSRAASSFSTSRRGNSTGPTVVLHTAFSSAQ